MNRQKFRGTLLKSVEDTSAAMVKLSKLSLEEFPDGEDYFNYEATYKAHLYHTLLLNGVNYEDLHLESRPEKDRVKTSHIDLWYKDVNGGSNFLIEVKQVYGTNRAHDDIRDYDYRVRYSKSKGLKSGIIKDVIKLCDSCGIKEEYNGVMLMYWADPKVKENLDLNVIRQSILDQIREERPRIRTSRVELLWTSTQKTEYKSLT